MKLVRQMLFAAVFVGSLFSVNAQLTPGTALDMVQNLLAKLKVKINEQTSREAIMNTEFMEWSIYTMAKTNQSLRIAQQDADLAQATIDQCRADIDDANRKIALFGGRVARLSIDLDAATKLRDKAYAEFVEDNQVLTEAVESIGMALKIIKDQMQAYPDRPLIALNQVDQANKMDNLIYGFKAVMEAASLPIRDEKRLTALLQTNGNDDDDIPQPVRVRIYSAQSRGVRDMLEDLREEAEDKLYALQTDEKKDKHDYEVLKMKIENEIADLEEDIATQKQRKADAEKLKAEAEDDLRDANKRIEKFSTFLDKLKREHDHWVAGHKRFVVEQEDQLHVVDQCRVAVADAITHVGDGVTQDLVSTGTCRESKFGCCADGITAKSDEDGSQCPRVVGGCASKPWGCCDDGVTAKSDVHGTNCWMQQESKQKAIKTTKGRSHKFIQFSFIQLDDQDENSLQSRAIDMLRRTADETNSVELSQLASRVKMVLKYHSDADKFGAVKEMITNLIKDLKTKLEAEIKEEHFCRSEMRKCKKNLDKAGLAVYMLEADIDKAEAWEADTLEKYNQDQDDMKTGADENMNRTKMFNKATKMYITNKKELQAGIDAISEAQRVIEEYFGKPTWKKLEDGEPVLLQLKAKDSESADDGYVPEPRPETTNIHNENVRTTSAHGIHELLNHVKTDLAKALAEEDTEYAEDKAEFEEAGNAFRLEYFVLQEGLPYKKQNYLNAHRDVLDLKIEEAAKHRQEQRMIKKWKRLQERCIMKHGDYFQRKKKRMQEIQGLKDALEILENQAIVVTERKLKVRSSVDELAKQKYTLSDGGQRS